MKSKYKLKKEVKYILIVSIILISILIVLNLLKTKSYSVEYTRNNVDISENYLKEEESYFFELTYNKVKYNFISKQKPLSESKLIKKVKIYTEEDEICLELKSEYLTTYPQCSKGKEVIDYHLVSDKMKENLNEYYNEEESEETEINNYNIYLNEQNLLLWNYKGFYKLNKANMDYIKIFNKDIYDISLAVKINEYILIPNYEQKYNFNEVYIINTEKDTVEKWTIEHEISFDSKILGINDRSIFLLDKKNKIEYELVPHKQKMRIVGTNTKKGTLYEYGKEVKESITKIIADNREFKYQKDYIFTIKNDKLYLQYFDSKELMKISNNNIDKIVNINEDTIYYISKNTLYKYNIKDGEKKIIEYSEWEFNNNNMVFIN